MQPSYQSGFYAPGRGVAKHPELWRGCVGAWNPGLGNTGLSLRDWSGGQNNGVLTNGPTWGVSDGRQALTFDGVNDRIYNRGVQRNPCSPNVPASPTNSHHAKHISFRRQQAHHSSTMY
jgi:hypothetical protein